MKKTKRPGLLVVLPPPADNDSSESDIAGVVDNLILPLVGFLHIIFHCQEIQPGS